MGRMDFDTLFRRRLDPPAHETKTGKYEGMHLVFDDREFEFAIERRNGYGQPRRLGGSVLRYA